MTLIFLVYISVRACITYRLNKKHEKKSKFTRDLYAAFSMSVLIREIEGFSISLRILFSSQYVNSSSRLCYVLDVVFLICCPPAYTNTLAGPDGNVLVNPGMKFSMMDPKPPENASPKLSRRYESLRSKCHFTSHTPPLCVPENSVEIFTITSRQLHREYSRIFLHRWYRVRKSCKLPG